MALRIIYDEITGDPTFDEISGDIIVVEVEEPAMTNFNVNFTDSAVSDVPGYNNIDDQIVGVIVPTSNAGEWVDENDVIIPDLTLTLNTKGITSGPGVSGSGITSFPVTGGVTDPYPDPGVTEHFWFANSATDVDATLSSVPNGIYRVTAYYIATNTSDVIRLGRVGMSTATDAETTKDLEGNNGENNDYLDRETFREFTRQVEITDGTFNFTVHRITSGDIAGLTALKFAEVEISGPPTLDTTLPNLTNRVGDTVNLTPGDNFTGATSYEVVNLPPGVVFNLSTAAITGTLSGKAPGAVQIQGINDFGDVIGGFRWTIGEPKISRLTAAGDVLVVNGANIAAPAALYLSADGQLTSIPNGKPVANLVPE